ncbi:MAG TPA: T9SS type A sorting domain-containing protein [Chitinophagales bacterium]|nr:T9SS type A sorting domain-containing protein [Chitinophagales bacterium]
MKKTILILTVVVLGSIHKSFAQAGDLDSTFGINGTVTTAVCTNSYASSVALQSDGKIVAAGGSWDCITVVRYNSNGSLDSSFGTNGIVTTQPSNQCQTGSVVIQPDGKIISASGDEFGFILIRYQPNGTIDSSFGTNGVFFLSGPEYSPSIALQQDSKIVMAGSYFMWVWPHSYWLNLARCDSNGILDTSFFQSNMGTFDGYNASATCVALQPDGKIVTAGATDSNELFKWCFGIARFNNNGTPDSSFGVNGHVTTAIGVRAVAYAIVIQSDGKIVAGGYSLDSIFGYFTLVRYKPDGSLDSTFGNDGVVISSIENSVVGSLAIQSDGKIVAVGYVSATIALVRYNIDGSLDNTFGTNGVVTNGVSTGDAVVIQPDEKILTAGRSQYGFTLIRYLSGLEVGMLNFGSNNLPTLTYPNPVQSQATLQYTLTNEECITISLYNIQGSQVQTFITNETRYKGEHKEALDLDEVLPSGNYILAISNGIHSQGIEIVKE